MDESGISSMRIFIPLDLRSKNKENKHHKMILRKNSQQKKK